MKKSIVSVVFLFLIFSSIYSTDSSVSNFQVELQFFKQVYRISDPVPVLINIVNRSGEKTSFRVSPLIHESFFFELKTPKNEDVPIADNFQVEMKDNASAGSDFREITLAENESFSRFIDIAKWFDLKEPGYYYIKGIFFPNPDNKNEQAESFYYKILLKPPSSVEKQLNKEESNRQVELENVQKFPPYEVIGDFFDAKMKKDWERFLLHIDAEKLISSFDEYKAAYENARSGKYRLEVLEDFKRYLTVHWQDRIMAYKITKTQIEENKATVGCDVDYKIETLSYSMRYLFYLSQNHLGQWLIYDYTALKIK
jgi:hypothetical protein